MCKSLVPEPSSNLHTSLTYYIGNDLHDNCNHRSIPTYHMQPTWDPVITAHSWAEYQAFWPVTGSWPPRVWSGKAGVQLAYTPFTQLGCKLAEAESNGGMESIHRFYVHCPLHLPKRPLTFQLKALTGHMVAPLPTFASSSHKSRVMRIWDIDSGQVSQLNFELDALMFTFYHTNPLEFKLRHQQN